MSKHFRGADGSVPLSDCTALSEKAIILTGG